MRNSVLTGKEILVEFEEKRCNVVIFFNDNEIAQLFIKKYPSSVVKHRQFGDGAFVIIKNILINEIDLNELKGNDYITKIILTKE